jgi:hypothetical protein
MHETLGELQALRRAWRVPFLAVQGWSPGEVVFGPQISQRLWVLPRVSLLNWPILSADISTADSAPEAEPRPDSCKLLKR